MVSSPAFFEQIHSAPFVQDDDARAWELLSDFKAADSSGQLAAVCETSQVESFIVGIVQASPYLAGLMRRDPTRLARFLSEPIEQSLDEIFSQFGDAVAGAQTPDVMKATLRRFKSDVALLTAMADIAGVWPVMRVTDVLTRCADDALQASVRFLFSQSQKKLRSEVDRETVALNSGYFVLAMGKHGAHELNYSSDIDVIVFFDYDRLATVLVDGEEPLQFATKISRDLVNLMQERTGDGYVFRMDLRLRPDPNSTLIALSTKAGLTYYESAGQNWERAALIKARVVAGDIETGAAFLEEIAPFVWRRHLDFASISDIQAMKRQIHAFRGFDQIAVAGHNIKLGRGGIREIEFFVQTQQLIAGGRQPKLRQRKTLETLSTLSDLGWISESVRDDLEHAYLFLRRLEHRLQMINDEQTHTLPTDMADLTRLAHFLGFESFDEPSTQLLKQLATVQKHYAALFEDTQQLTANGQDLVFTGVESDPATLETLARFGFQRGEDVLRIVKGWHTGRYPAMRSTIAREKLTLVQPRLLECLSHTADPDGALVAFDRFLATLPAGIQLFSLLGQHPKLLELMSNIMGSAPRLASILSRRSRLLDAVIDPQTFGPEALTRDLDAAVVNEISRARDLEDVLDRARIVGSEQAFLIGIRVLSGGLSAVRAGEAYARLAERMIDALLNEAQQDLAHKHGGVPGGSVAVVAMGKLGGFEMTAASDLDLIVVYDYPDGVLQTDGPRPLDCTTYYSRLTQRLLSLLTAPTVEGALYDVDLRLRPSGNQGPVATRLPSFISYQATKAWTWEHMALTRARVVSAPASLKDSVEDSIRTALLRPRDASKLTTDVLEMRNRIDVEKNTDDIWDLKFVRGGLIDIEFIAQYLQLREASQSQAVLHPTTAVALEKLRDADVLSFEDAACLTQAAARLHALMQVLRLCLTGPFSHEKAPPGLLEMLAKAGDCPNFEVLEDQLRQQHAEVFSAFARIVGE